MDSIGRSGGIIVLWDKREWKGELIDSGIQMLPYKLFGISQDLTWCLPVVYSECDRKEREELWWEISAIRGICEGPWVIFGDLNVSRFPSERTNYNRITRAMADFNQCINDLELLDPPLSGGYTWRRGQNHSCATRIDRFLFSS